MKPSQAKLNGQQRRAKRHFFQWCWLLLLLLSSLTIARAQTNVFFGAWTNSDPKGGVTHLVISHEEKTWRIQAWGSCSPTDCDWGKVELKCLGENVSDPVAKYGFAHWDHKFADAYMTLRREKEKLVTETFTCFKDESGRSDYRSVYLLTRPGSPNVANNAGPITEAQRPDEDRNRRTFLEVVAVDPPSPAKLKAGQKASVKIRYQCATAEKVRIWVQPYTEGAYTLDGFYAASPAEPNGPPGEVQRFVGVNGTAKVDELRVKMVDAESRKELTNISQSVDLQWEGSVPKPETVAPVGQAFPSLKFTSLQGHEIDVSKMKGQVVLVDFWATWCGPCRQEIPNLVAAYEKYHADGFEIVGISLDKNKEALQRYIKEQKMPWPEYFDGKEWDNVIGKKFSVQSIPCSYLIDRKGVVRNISLRGERLTEAIAKLLK